MTFEETIFEPVKVSEFQLENRDLEKKLQQAQQKMEVLQKENEALQTRINAMGIKERITPSKRGRFLAGNNLLS